MEQRPHLGAEGGLQRPRDGGVGRATASSTAATPCWRRAYTEWGAGIGYRFPRWEIRLDGDNLGDERAAVSESELGDAQFYRLPARSLRLTASARF